MDFLIYLFGTLLVEHFRIVMRYGGARIAGPWSQPSYYSVFRLLRDLVSNAGSSTPPSWICVECCLLTQSVFYVSTGAFFFSVTRWEVDRLEAFVAAAGHFDPAEDTALLISVSFPCAKTHTHTHHTRTTRA